MKARTPFSRKELLVVLCCLSLVLLNIGAIGSGGRRRAKEAVCLSNLRQWAVVFEMHTEDNNGYFLSGEGGSSGRWWIEPLQPYYKDLRLLICPQAATPVGTSLVETPFQAWQIAEYVGSYGLNGWICNPAPGASQVWGRSPISYYWRSSDVTDPHNIPVFSDMWFVDAWPSDHDAPPLFDGSQGDTVSVDQMTRVCVNRHNGAVNALFMDWSARKVGLKELWTLKWHRQFDTEGPWTKAKGVRPEDWPDWMRDFKDY